MNTRVNGEASTVRPWYRQLWPWLLMIPPLGAVCGGIATMALAIKSDDGLVSKDYYKDGLAINLVMEKDIRAQEMGLSASARFNLEDGRVQILMDDSLPNGDDLTLALLHPTRDRLDQRVVLASGDGQQYVGAIEQLPPGLWYLHLESDAGAWRLSGRLRLPGEVQSQLQPARR